MAPDETAPDFSLLPEELNVYVIDSTICGYFGLTNVSETSVGEILLL
jgi:hypothetical protein